MSALGTLGWVERTNGKLGLWDKLTMIAQGVRARAAARKQAKSEVKLRYIEVDDILPPDSKIAHEALAMCEEASKPFLFHHCLRAYFWARLLDDGKETYDDEAVFVATMLHDMGLTDAHSQTDGKEQCFTIAGARMVDDLAQEHRWSDKRVQIAANAITLHLNVTVHARHGKEAQMVRAGSGADVAGLGLGGLHKDQIDAVCLKYPRLDFRKEILSVLKAESEMHPCSRIAFLQRRLGFRDLIRSSMFEN